MAIRMTQHKQLPIGVMIFRGYDKNGNAVLDAGQREFHIGVEMPHGTEPDQLVQVYKTGDCVHIHEYRQQPVESQV